MRAVYATVERVMRATDIKASAYSKEEILTALEAASDSVDRLVNQGDATRPAFAPWTGTITFDWPVSNNDDAYRFWLNQFRLHSVTDVTSGGNDLFSDTLLWPSAGPPHSAIAINTAGTRALEIASTGTGQESLAIGGVWGTLGSDRSRSGWALGASASDSSETLTVNAPIGIGSLLLLGDERVIVTDRSWTESGQTAGALAASMASQAVTVQTGSEFLVGEEIIIDSERLLVRDIISDTLIVQRAVGGSALAEHAGAAAIQWARSCSVERGVLGTVAVSHSDGDAVTVYFPPAMIEQLTVAYAIDQRAQETVGYARSLDHIRDRSQLSSKKVGGDVGGAGIGALEDRVLAAYGRMRHRAI